MSAIERLNEMQAWQKWWEEKIIPPEERTPQSRYERMVEEFQELGEAIRNLDGSFEKAHQAGLELADVFIIGFGLADTLGFDIERLVREKMETNHRKYSHVENQQLRQEGLSWQEAMAKQKEQWRAQNGK